MVDRYFAMNRKLSSQQLLNFSNDLDKHAIEDPNFFNSELLKLIERHFGYVASSLTRYVKNHYHGMIVNDSAIFDSYSISQQYSSDFQKQDPFTDAILQAKKSEKRPLVLKSSEILNQRSLDTYTNYLGRLGLKWSLALPFDEHHLVIDKHSDEDDFSIFEMSFWESIYKLINEKYRLSKTLSNHLITHEFSDLILDATSVGMLILDNLNKIIDSNKRGLVYLADAMETKNVSRSVSELISRALNICNAASPDLSEISFSENGFSITVYFYGAHSTISGYKYLIIRKDKDICSSSKSISDSSFSKHYKLTAREIEVLQLIYEGNTYQQTADKLFINISTVRTHINNIFQKSEVNSQHELFKKFRYHDKVI